MRLSKITLATAAVAATLALACTGTHEAGAKSATPEVHAAPVNHPPTNTVSANAAPVGSQTSGPQSTAPQSSAPQATVGSHPTPPVLDSLIKGTLPARGLYVFRFAANTRRLKHLIGIADSTEINALIIDVKDEFGLNYESSDPLVRKNAGTQVKARNLQALVDTIRAHGILPVARIVVFKDSVTARNNPDHTIRKADGSAWHDKKGQTWVNPYANAIWEYNFRVAEEAVRMGFGEIQFDYIRFPEPYKSLPPQVFAGANGVSKPDAIAQFLKEANARLDKLGVRTTADIFGLVTTVQGPLEVAQHWERLAPVTDVLLPMVYPSHYVHGSFGIPVPNAEPYKVVNISISRARERDAKLGIPPGEHVRPWLQAFSLGKPEYTAEDVRKQKQAVYDAGYDGWVLWHPGSKF